MPTAMWLHRCAVRRTEQMTTATAKRSWISAGNQVERPLIDRYSVKRNAKKVNALDRFALQHFRTAL
jgi:hypothetical protein